MPNKYIIHGATYNGDGTSSGAAVDYDQVAAAVVAAMQTSPTPFPRNVKAVNDVTIKGVGTPANPWNPA